MWNTKVVPVIFETEKLAYNNVIFPELPMCFRDYLNFVAIRKPLEHPSIDQYTLNIAARATLQLFGLKKKGRKRQFFGLMRSTKYFSTEVRAHERLDKFKCPYIIKMHEYIKLSEQEGLIVTRFCNIFNFKTLRPFAKLIVYQLLQAIKVCHDNNVVHRDIKPDNIVWKWYNDKPHIYLTDFGISSVSDEEKYYPEMYRGTPCYMAPEIFFMRMVGHDYKPSDIWGAGVILAEMLLNKPEMLKEDRKLKKWNKNKEEWLGEDPTACDLLTKMLVEEPKDRVLVDDALAHAYFDEVREVQQSDKKRKHDRIVDQNNETGSTSQTQQKKIKTDK